MLIKIACSLLLAFSTWSAFAAEISGPIVPLAEIEKARKRLYLGGRDEEDIKVLAALPEAGRKTDERVIQNEVHKALFNQELPAESPEESADPEIGH